MNYKINSTLSHEEQKQELDNVDEQTRKRILDKIHKEYDEIYKNTTLDFNNFVTAAIEEKLENDNKKGIKWLEENYDEFFRGIVAQNEATKEETLDELTNDSNWRVRMKVAANENASDKVRKILSKDEEWRVREEVARNRKTEYEVLEDLAEDPYWLVREGVKENPKLNAEKDGR